MHRNVVHCPANGRSAASRWLAAVSRVPVTTTVDQPLESQQ